MKIDEKNRIVILDGNDVAVAIDAYVVAHRIHVGGPRTIRLGFRGGEMRLAMDVNAQVYVDPSGRLHDNGDAEDRRDQEKVRRGLANDEVPMTRRGYLVTHGIKSDPRSRINTHLVLAASADEAAEVWSKNFEHQQDEIKEIKLADYGVIGA